MGEMSSSRYTVEVVKFLEKKGVKYQLIPIATKKDLNYNGSL